MAVTSKSLAQKTQFLYWLISSAKKYHVYQKDECAALTESITGTFPAEGRVFIGQINDRLFDIFWHTIFDGGNAAALLSVRFDRSQAKSVSPKAFYFLDGLVYFHTQ